VEPPSETILLTGCGSPLAIGGIMIWSCGQPQKRGHVFGRLERRADHIAATTFMKMPWLLKLMSVRSSEKFVKLYPSPAFTCLPRWR